MPRDPSRRKGAVMSIRSLLSRAAAVVFTTAVLLGAGAVSASAFGASSATIDEANPQLAQTGYDFTPMLIVAAVFLLVAGVTVILAKYVVARSSH
jgi:hypothetical protein